jgi:hypothetical protein
MRSPPSRSLSAGCRPRFVRCARGRTERRCFTSGRMPISRRVSLSGWLSCLCPRQGSATRQRTDGRVTHTPLRRFLHESSYSERQGSFACLYRRVSSLQRSVRGSSCGRSSVCSPGTARSTLRQRRRVAMGRAAAPNSQQHSPDPEMAQECSFDAADCPTDSDHASADSAGSTYWCSHSRRASIS